MSIEALIEPALPDVIEQANLIFFSALASGQSAESHPTLAARVLPSRIIFLLLTNRAVRHSSCVN